MNNCFLIYATNGMSNIKIIEHFPPRIFNGYIVPVWCGVIWLIYGISLIVDVTSENPAKNRNG
jgi:hypothetical protein